MPANLVDGKLAYDVAAYVASVASRPGKDTGKLATAVAAPGAGKPVAAKNGKLQMPADANGQLAYITKEATAEPGPLEVLSKNPSSTPHDIAIEGNGVDEKGETAQQRRHVVVLGHRQGRQVHVLLLAARTPRRRHGRRAHRQVGRRGALAPPG